MEQLQKKQRFVEDIPEDQNVTQAIANGRKIIGIDGKWYDVTYFLPYHPGGPVLEKFIGHDASIVFHAHNHSPEVLRRCKVMGSYTMLPRHPADKDFTELIEVFKEKGYFKTDLQFYIKKILVLMVLWTAVFCCLIGFEQWYVHYFGGVLLALVYQQAGFLMHDFMHTTVLRSRYLDRIGGLIFGTFFLGVSAHWWQDEHRIHHCLTNTVDVGTNFIDPQMWEDTWAQNIKMFPLFKGKLAKFLIKIQHLTFVPACILFGRIAIIVDSLKQEHRLYEWVMILFHWSWMCYFLSYLPNWQEICIVYLIAAYLEGILHFQLVLSHYCREFCTLDELHKSSWYECMINNNMNIDNPIWQDWFFGGLNFHIEHHLFPMMSRQYLRAASPYIQALCHKHSIKYESMPFFSALVQTLITLKKASHHYGLDPR